MSVYFRNAWKAPIFDLLHGKIYVDEDGIEMCIRHTVWPSSTGHELSARPTETGKQTEKYKEIKRILRDDWTTDLSSVDSLYDIAEQVGVLGEYLQIMKNMR